MNRRTLLALFVGVVFAASTAFAQSSTWTIDKNHAEVNFQIRHAAVSTVRGSIGNITGTVVWNEKDLSKASVNATIDTNTVSTNNETRDKHLKSPDFFNVEKFPTMTFKSTSVTRANGKLEVTGDLTLAGVTRPVTLDVDGPTAPVKGMRGGLVTGFSATGAIKRSDFNFGQKYTEPILGDEVKFTIDLEADQM